MDTLKYQISKGEVNSFLISVPLGMTPLQDIYDGMVPDTFSIRLNWERVVVGDYNSGGCLCFLLSRFAFAFA